MKLVIAEKPSVAQSIAKVLGVNRRCDGYLEGPCGSGGPALTADRCRLVRVGELRIQTGTSFIKLL